jgi:hypothetical protein
MVSLKRIYVFILVLLCVATFALLAGCGKDGDAVSVNAESGDAAAENGEEQVEVIEEDGKKITVEESQEEGGTDKVTLEGEGGEQSTIEVQDQAPSEEALGAPIYPGSQFTEDSGVSGTTTSGDKQVSVTGAEFTTTDAITKVVEWYKGKLGEPMTSAPETATWMYQGQDGSIVTVIVELFEDRVKITIAKVSGDIDMNL